MKLPHLLCAALCLSASSVAGPVPEAIEERQAPPPQRNKHLRPVLEKRQKFAQGQPISADGKGAPILGMKETQHQNRTVGKAANIESRWYQQTARSPESR